jgi:hypothetical protein
MAEFGGYQRSIESIDRGNAGVSVATDSIKVFISYADKDKVIKDELRRSLAVLEAEKTITSVKLLRSILLPMNMRLTKICW